mmetsp:Transcript_59958/g.109831  ORF Transcript_59958/g.109831 Transcript_59958/m.109831 type:complete len:96 (+) Transcript_59958:208-495(+)
MVECARERLSELPDRCKELVEIRHGDILDMELTETPTCVTMYLMPDHYAKLEAMLERFIAQGMKVVVYAWSLKGEHWKSRLVDEGNGWWLYTAAC